jgi:hypothetical protein
MVNNNRAYHGSRKASIMTIDTRVFRRIVEEHRQAGINGIAETMTETTRFGLFNPDYIQGCASDRFETHLKQIQEVSS